MMADDTVQACPECEKSQIRVRRPNHPHSKPHVDGRWHCNTCGARFDEPITRPSDGVMGTIPHSGLARKLLDADPDDVSREAAGL